MQSYYEERLLPFSKQALYSVVWDVEAYPLFLPWCQACHIVKTISETEKVVDLTIGYGPLKETYRSRVVGKPYQHIEVFYEEGPFQHLENTWIFYDTNATQTRVVFDIRFSFKRVILQKLIEKMFHESAKILIQSFEKRLESLHS